MTNEHIPYKNWFQRNWIWLASLFLLLALLIFSLPSKVKTATAHVLIGYTDTELVDSAVSISNKNDRVKEMLGNLKPVDNLAILEGCVKYSKELDSVFMSVRIKGTKGKGVLDIYAFKKNRNSEYERLNVRLKGLKFKKETIPILLNSD